MQGIVRSIRNARAGYAVEPAGRVPEFIVISDEALMGEVAAELAEAPARWANRLDGPSLQAATAGELEWLRRGARGLQQPQRPVLDPTGWLDWAGLTKTYALTVFCLFSFAV